jgi:glycosyltransferase involved in cell wall biosynthesis
MKSVCMLVINALTHDTRVQKEARPLAEAGYAVRSSALHGDNLPESETRDGYRVERIKVRSWPWGTSVALRSFKYLEFCLGAIDQIHRRQPDVVHAHDVNALVPSFVAPRLARARLIRDAHGLWAERQAPLLKSDLLRRGVGTIEGFLACRADAVTTVNPSIGELLERELRLSPSPLR